MCFNFWYNLFIYWYLCCITRDLGVSVGVEGPLKKKKIGKRRPKKKKKKKNNNRNKKAQKKKKNNRKKKKKKDRNDPTKINFF